MINNVSDLNSTTRETFGMNRFPVNAGIYRPNLNYEIERVSNEGEKQLSLVRLLRENEGRGVVYAATVKEVKAVTDYLKHIGFDVAPYHEHLGPIERLRNRDRFMAGDLKAIVVTNDTMDIDKPDIRFVIHYNVPVSLEAYYRESSCAGRDGRTARCTLLFQIADRRTQLFFASRRFPKPEEVTAVYETLESLDADLAPAPLEQIQTSVSNVARIKVRAILSLLKNMGFIKEHRGARYTLLKRDLSAREMDRLAGQYTSKGESDREKFERMTLYGQSPECRWKLLLEYFGDHTNFKECGHCDNCSRPSAEQTHPPESATKPDFIDLLFAYHQPEEARIRPGDMVKLPAHGEVKVKAVEGDKIVVSLPGGETRKFKQEWVIR
ncbi:MAG: RecQ family zinc-binding domain-containing protein [Blastocatellia bacterium]